MRSVSVAAARHSRPVLVFAMLPRAILTILASAFLTVAAALPAAARVAVVLNSDDNTISVISTDTYRETSRLPIGRHPHHLILAPDGRDLIIANAGSNELVFLDPSTGAIKSRLPGVSDPYQVGFSPDRKFFVTTSLRLDRIDIYDAETLKLVSRLPARSMPSHIAFSPDSKRVFVSLQGTNSLTAIELATGNVLWTAPAGRQPAGVWTRKGGTLLVGIMGSDYVAEIDPENGQVLRKIETGRGAHNFIASPDGKLLYVSNRVAGTISILDADTLAVRSVMTAPGGPDDMALSGDGRELWVTGRWRSFVNVIELASGTVKATIPVGRSPHGIYVYQGQ